MILLKLFISFLQIGAFSFGGGYAAMPLIQNQVIDLNHWLNLQEFTDLLTISQMSPGPIAINAATFVGNKISGISGAIVATLGCILPSCIIVMVMAKLYLKYRQLDTLQGILTTLRPAVVAMIATAGVSILVTSFFPTGVIALASVKLIAVFIFVISLVLLLKYKLNPILVMFLAGIMNVIYALIIKII